MNTDQLLRNFGQRIKLLRKEQGLTQFQLAELTSFDQTYISLIERGKRNLSLGNIKRFADVFKVSLSTIFRGI
ncbi:helix-turn-helix domain-containing protein [bacterium]|nr:helix-turn-helix domain-containing protein [bacterium]